MERQEFLVRRPEMPSMSRRAVSLAAAAIAGGISGYIFSPNGTLVIVPLSLLAGISSLWSP